MRLSRKNRNEISDTTIRKSDVKKLKVGDKVLLKCTVFKGKHKIEDMWENTIYEVVKQPIVKMPVFKVESMEGDSNMKVVHWNLLLPLFSDPSDHSNISNTESVVDQTVCKHALSNCSGCSYQSCAGQECLQ